MTKNHAAMTVHIDNNPEAVMNYIADVRNRPLYIESLKSIKDVQGSPEAVGTSWRWTWSALGMEFEGTGKCLRHEAGSVYAFQTEGGITSTWTYRAEPEGDGTKLTVEVDYEVPKSAQALESAAEKMKQSAAERIGANLKKILDQ